MPYTPTRSVADHIKIFGDPNKPDEAPDFFYMVRLFVFPYTPTPQVIISDVQLHHNLECAAEQYEADVRESLYRVYCSEPWNDKQTTPPETTTKKLYVNGSAVGMVTRLPRPSRLPKWLTETELQYYVREYTEHGFSGGLHWYQTMDLNTMLSPESMRARIEIKQPALFIAGELLL